MGDDYGYAETQAPPMNATVYKQLFDAFSEFGFNYIRLHSHWESPGYFDAADEHGFFVSPGLPSNCNTPACMNLTLRTWNTLISTHRNNPSVMDACMGNEGYGKIASCCHSY